MGMAPLVGRVDLSDTYTLISGVKVVIRSDDAVQIGTEPPRWLILHHPPPDAVAILRRLDGSARLIDILAQYDADPLTWIDLLTRLLEQGLLVSAADWVFPGLKQDVLLDPERSSLVYRHGMSAARRLLATRQESLVVVRGSGRLASAIAGLLAASGVGHVYQEPDSAARSPSVLAALPAARPNPAGRDPSKIGGATPTGYEAAAPGRPLGRVGSRPSADAAVLATAIRRVSRSVRTHPPAAHQHPALVVLAGDAPPAAWTAADLLREQIPYLAVRTQLASAIVGPLVLPGRSTCTLCVLRHRGEIDLGWSSFEAGLGAEPVTSPAALVWTAASVAVIDILTHLDGTAVPGTVDGTVEWWAGELAPRRRSWSTHPECECRAATGINAVAPRPIERE